MNARGPHRDLATLATSLDLAVTTGGDFLDPTAMTAAQEAMERGLQRLELGVGHTVVALAGATGSGKSSLFNALAEMEIAEVGARRPLTSQPMACVWGASGSEPLLDWLEVPRSRRLQRESVLDAERQAPLHGLVLLDLPDHDSIEVAHRVEVDRLVGQVDLLIWVLDPQKYADDALHSRYLQQLTDHDAVMLVVLNQVDRLDPTEVEACLRDLRRLLDADGLSSVALLPVSAITGQGVEGLRAAVVAAVQTRSSVVDRSRADLTAISNRLRRGLADAEPDLRVTRAQLVRDLGGAAGLAAAADAVASEYVRRRAHLVQWLPREWVQRLRPDALGRLGAQLRHSDLTLIADVAQPVSTRALRAQVQVALDAAVAQVGSRLPSRWASAVAEAARPSADVVQALDAAIAGVDLEAAPPAGARLLRLLQWVLASVALAGAGWLFVVGAVQLAGRFTPEPPSVVGVPLPLLLLIGGLAVGWVISVLGAASVGRVEQACRDAAAARLDEAVAGVAEEMVLQPVQEVLNRHRTVRLALGGHGPDDVPAQAPALAPDPAPEPSPEPAPESAAQRDPEPSGHLIGDFGSVAPRVDPYEELPPEARAGLARAYVPAAPGEDGADEAEPDAEPGVEPDTEDTTRLAV